MSTHHRVALATAVATVVLVVVDLVVSLVTGERTVITDDTQGPAAAGALMSVWLGLTFAALAAVVRGERAAFAAAPRAARWVRRPLLVGLVALAVGLTVVNPVQLLAGIDSGTFYDASGLVALLCLLAVFVSVLVLGLALLRRNPLGIGGRILALVGPVIGATVLLAVVAPDLASPVFVTATVVLGIATLGLRPASSAAAADPEGAGERQPV
ncbi:hypothetical protein E8D34_04865 [Nocardioides sp. GY 10113]|uniref:hypothetical protein n=1 Tax=Nocardioides sp. GY 10113 TaxID=2569761 RepID=UPI0010A8246D|nr:hypothetical protein [Nocardioides sp. GY 10113]TIC88275.1 hypothetical protein E8D34_04865 [Nocardioides sp. GY 10113]